MARSSRIARYARIGAGSFLAELAAFACQARVYEDAVGRVAVDFDDIGEQSLKNIDRPMRVYKLRFGNAAFEATPRHLFESQRQPACGKSLFLVSPHSRSTTNSNAGLPPTATSTPHDRDRVSLVRGRSSAVPGFGSGTAGRGTTAIGSPQL